MGVLSIIFISMWNEAISAIPLGVACRSPDLGSTPVRPFFNAASLDWRLVEGE